MRPARFELATSASAGQNGGEFGWGWVGLRCDDPDPDEGDDEPAIALYCPVCAAREFGYRPDVAERYVCAWEPIAPRSSNESRTPFRWRQVAARLDLCHRPTRLDVVPVERGRHPFMHAVVARSTIEDFEQARKYLREQGIPRLSQMPGFVSGHWVRLGENAGASMIVFETEEAAQTAADMLRTNPPPAVNPVSIEVGEVQEHA